MTITRGRAARPPTPAPASASAAEANSAFECASSTAAASRPAAVRRATADWGVGEHLPGTRAIDWAGNVDATPASYSWTITVASTPPATRPTVVGRPLGRWGESTFGQSNAPWQPGECRRHQPPAPTLQPGAQERIGTVVAWGWPQDGEGRSTCTAGLSDVVAD